ncbi:hypothetical protein NDU88_006157 [Pleurodeles waltl]|uniref:Uncharacterized protein n=1 Tax=Pleurodeles waltl TaxID=8319 RepID=A0AAV7RKQ3_PLEWA|nr:hypothetical protein NDU88_006157 [Pleurodeles waltl]
MEGTGNLQRRSLLHKALSLNLQMQKPQSPQRRKRDRESVRCQRKRPFRPHCQEAEKSEPSSPKPKRKDYNHFRHFPEQSRQELLDQGNWGKSLKKTLRPRTGQGIGLRCTLSEETGEVEEKRGIQGSSKKIQCRNTPPIANPGKHRRNQNKLQGGRVHPTQEI